MSRAEGAPAVRFTVTNRSPQATALVLEPAGEVYSLTPGQSCVVRYVGDPAPALALDIGDGEIKLWEDGAGILQIDEPEKD